MMIELERHVSPDGLLTVHVVRDQGGDLAIGFLGCSWHTHGDILAELHGSSPEEASHRFVRAITSSELVIVVSRIDGAIDDVWIADDAQHDELKYALPNETIEKRFWDGRVYTGSGE
jgi:hypothetical protein